MTCTSEVLNEYCVKPNIQRQRTLLYRIKDGVFTNVVSLSKYPEKLYLGVDGKRKT